MDLSLSLYLGILLMIPLIFVYFSRKRIKRELKNIDVALKKLDKKLEK